MNEMFKIWLADLYLNEIDEVKGSIENEELWAAAAEADAEMHRENIATMEAYIAELKEKIAELKN